MFLNFKHFYLDVDIHKPSVQSVNDTASDVMQSGDPNMAAAIKSKLDDLNHRYDDIADRSQQRLDDVNDIRVQMDKLGDNVKIFDEWLAPTMEGLDDEETQQLSGEEFKDKVWRDTASLILGCQFV